MGDAAALALAALSKKERSEAELEGWLRARGVGEEETAEALARLRAEGLVDDARFAARFAEDKRELLRRGADRIREVLLRRGVGVEEVEAALGDDAGAELERAVAVLRRRGAEVGDDRGRGRALGLLARRGFDCDLAYEAVRLYERAIAAGSGP